MKKRYELNWYSRTITTYLDGELVGVIDFTAAMAYQREIVRMWLAAVHRQRFELTGYTADKAWVYEGTVRA